jgi:hypothetical protein
MLSFILCRCSGSHWPAKGKLFSHISPSIHEPFVNIPLLHKCNGWGVWHVWGIRGMHTGFWWGNMKERGHLARPRSRWDDSLKMDIKEIG